MTFGKGMKIFNKKKRPLTALMLLSILLCFPYIYTRNQASILISDLMGRYIHPDE